MEAIPGHRTLARGYGQGALGGPRGWKGPNNDRDGGFALPRPEKKVWPNAVTGTVRDNGDLELATGDRIRHTDFGDGRVLAITGEGTKRVAHVAFDSAGQKKLLIKIAPIEKL